MCTCLQRAAECYASAHLPLQLVACAAHLLRTTRRPRQLRSTTGLKSRASSGPSALLWPWVGIRRGCRQSGGRGIGHDSLNYATCSPVPLSTQFENENMLYETLFVSQGLAAGVQATHLHPRTFAWYAPTCLQSPLHGFTQSACLSMGCLVHSDNATNSPQCILSAFVLQAEIWRSFCCVG